MQIKSTVPLWGRIKCENEVPAMANTYTSIYLHIIFAVKYRAAVLTPLVRGRVHAYMRASLEQMGHHCLAIGGVDDHVHVMINYNTSQALPDMIRTLKVATTKMINDQKLMRGKFQWQSGYACLSYSKSQVDTVCRYINNQVEKHKHLTMRQELRDTLARSGIEYDERYIYEDPV